MAARETRDRDTPVRWSFPTRLGFRFAFIYIPLFFLSMIPLPPTTWAVRWFGTHVLHVTTTIRIASNDTVYDYVRTLCCLMVAAVAAFIWSALDDRRPHYQRL